MAATSSDEASGARGQGSAVILEFHGFLAEKMAPLGLRRGTRTLIPMNLESGRSVAHVLSSLVNIDDRYTLLFDAASQTLPEHVEIVLNDRVLDLQGGLNAVLHDGDTLTFLPAHAGG